MERIFLCILSLSLSGTLIGLLILLIHPLTKKYFSKRWNYYIWLLVIASLVLPVHFKFASLSKFTSHENLSFFAAQQVNDNTIANQQSSQSLSEKANVTNYTMTNSTIQTNTNLPLNKPVNDAASLLSQEKPFLSRLVSLAKLIWILGTLLILFLKLWNYLCFSICLKNNSIKVTDTETAALLKELSIRLSIKKIPKIYESTIVSSPITLGLWKPVVVLPTKDKTSINTTNKNIPNKNQTMLSLHHELIHVKRKDLWYKWTYQILLCLHWFNPILYVIGRTLNEDCELSCDEVLLGMLTEEGKKTYGNILIDIAQRNVSSYPIPCTTLLERKEDLKERLYSILNYKKQTKRKIFLSTCVFVIMLSITACSNALTGTVLPIQIFVPTDKDFVLDTAQSSLKSIWETAQEAQYKIQTDSSTNADNDPFLLELFSNDPAPINKNGIAWKVYDDEDLLAGEDICDYQWFDEYYGYGDTKFKCSEMFLHGSKSVLIIYAETTVQIQVNSSFTVADGKFKLVSIAPDKTISLIDDTGTNGKRNVTLQKGRNVIKMVGQETKVTSLNLSYDGLGNKSITDIYSSEGKETTASILKKFEAKTANKTELIDILPYIEDKKTVSEVLKSLLDQGVYLSMDELEEIFCYSDRKLSSQYLLEAIQDKKTDDLELESLLNLLSYMDTKNRDTLLLALIDKLNFAMLEDNISYLSTEGRSQCLTKYLEAGNILTASQYAEILPYLDSKTRTNILIFILDEGFTFEMLETCLPYLNTEGREQCLLKYLESGNTLTYSQFDDISPYLNNSIVEKIDNLMK